MKNLEKVLNDNLHILYGHPDKKKGYPEGIISVTYRRGQCLKELISPSLYPGTVTESASGVSKCNENECDICKNYVVFKNEFTCTATGKACKVRGDLTCKSDNVKVAKSASNSMLALPLKVTLSPALEITKVISILAKSGVEWPSIS